METKQTEQEALNKEFMEHLNRVVPYDVVASKKAGEERVRLANLELARKKDEK